MWPHRQRMARLLLPPCTRQVLRLLGAPLSPDPAAPDGSGGADGVGSGGADESREPPALTLSLAARRKRQPQNHSMKINTTARTWANGVAQFEGDEMRKMK